MPTSAVAVREAHAHLAFTLALQRALTTPLDAACWSPFSVASALGLAATGARGATRAELTALLLGADGALADHGALLAAAGTLSGGQVQCDVANTLWTRPDLPIRPEFTDELGRWPGGAARTAPFPQQPDEARKLINAHVAETTHGLIPELLGPGSIRPSIAAVLVNALYLKTAWRNRFPEHRTEPQPFHAPTGPATVPTMRLADKSLGYAAEDGWQVVVLPADGDVEAVVLLPDDDIAAAESRLDANRMARLLDAPVPRQVDLHLPKFRVRVKVDLKAALAGLGVGTMFTDAADFGGISDVPLTVDSVRHEAVLTIDEQGLEGAAATAVVMALAMHRAYAEPLVVRVDRPFLFLVRHRPTGVLYFLARVTRP